ncbi:MAG TPA: glucose-1-phosphate thymidylyltransferase RfbA [Candidatus Kapabacteria bacterium]|jgi:glucose-1-phosphate thymidylyltransferase|nr:glucose-1-phosphate thymidylyltransferase RfbA [Candidatus Kapabacteria bacterium]HOV93161.1 glucose-1-phosphate thymidylyltransferase RfbA [Candidatus Kapabacteria bacterium]
MITKGIILAGGNGTRLYPTTVIQSKQLLIVYDKPLIYYPLSTLMLAGIRDILIITTLKDLDNFKKLLGDGSQLGLNLQYAVQENPNGIAEAFIIGEHFIGNDQVCMILGDNIFYGKLDFLRFAIANNQGGWIFAYNVVNANEYGVVEISKDNRILSIEEKPLLPKSNFAIPGLYIFDNNVSEIAKKLSPSPRRELEITDIQKEYLKNDKLNVTKLGRGIAWFDTGTPENLLEAGLFVRAIQKRQGRQIACIEEIALYQQYITINDFNKLISTFPGCDYKTYCENIASEYK